MVKESLPRDQFRLYQLIWRRFAASRMAPAVYETTSVKDRSRRVYRFTVAASKVAFDGFMSVYVQEEDNQKGNVLSQSLEKGMELELKRLKPEQHFTQPPAHYTEASLVKTWKNSESDVQVRMRRPSQRSSAAVMCPKNRKIFT